MEPGYFRPTKDTVDSIKKFFEPVEDMHHREATGLSLTRIGGPVINLNRDPRWGRNGEGQAVNSET